MVGAAPQKFVVASVNVGSARRNSSAARGKFKPDRRSENPALQSFEAALENFKSAPESFKSALGNSKPALRNFSSALRMFGLAECVAELFFRIADLSDGGSELAMQIAEFFLASAGLPVCSAEF